MRSIAFYIAFYTGSVICVLGALLATPFSRRIVVVMTHAWSRWHRICARVLLGIHVRVEGKVPDTGCLVALKHESFFEAIDLPNLLDMPVPVAKAELFAIPGWGRVARSWGAISVDRTQGAGALRVMMREGRGFASEGRPLAIFPEGTRVPHGAMPPLQSGFAGLYKMLNVPVVPVAVYAGPLYHRRFKRAGEVVYRFFDPIEPGLPRAEIEARVHAAINAFNREGEGSVTAPEIG